MLLTNGVRKMKLHSFNRGVIQAFARSKLEMMITLPNVEAGLVNKPWRAEAYVKENVNQAYKEYDLNVKIMIFPLRSSCLRVNVFWFTCLNNIYYFLCFVNFGLLHYMQVFADWK